MHAAIIPFDAYLSQLHQYICSAVHLSTVSRYFNFRKNRLQKDAKILCMLFKSFWWYLVYRMTDQFCMHFSCCSAIMDCVGCEKCRLWGKLQVLGLGTALKILFSVDGEYRHHQHVSFLLSSFICRPLSLSGANTCYSPSMLFLSLSVFLCFTAAVAKKWSDCSGKPP